MNSKRGSTMTNRERLTKTDIYDLLYKLNNGMNDFACIIDALRGETCLCPAKKRCNQCISDWLNQDIDEGATTWKNIK